MDAYETVVIGIKGVLKISQLVLEEMYPFQGLSSQTELDIVEGKRLGNYFTTPVLFLSALINMIGL